LVCAVAGALFAVCLLAPTAWSEFPYSAQNGSGDYGAYRLPDGADKTPSDLRGKLTWMYAATALPDAPAQIDARELDGIRGAHLADPADVDQGWRTTTGRPDVTIAVLDSGIKWNDATAMRDLRRKTRLNRGELAGDLRPRADRSTATEPGADCAKYTAAGLDGYDRNGDGLFDVTDYACDSRVDPAPALGVGPEFAAGDGPGLEGVPMLDPQDVLIAFSDGTDGDGNGYVDDLVGWDFLDDDNDPYDDVQYGHGTGEARDSGAEAGNGGELGTCPNCMQVHLRVGTSFIADVNRFALATTYAVDNDVEVVQEALGTLNKSTLAGEAVDYAWEHGVTVIASAADEAAQHNNWPSSYPRVILVNSVTHTDALDDPGVTRASYLQFNGCTNFNAKIDLAIPSVSCSSDATGRASGMAGLIHAAAANAHEAGRLAAHPTCRRVGGGACLLSAAEVKQLMASGTIDGRPQADDVNFAQTPDGTSTELSCGTPGAALSACTDPFLAAPTTRGAGTPTVPRSYPARRGHDQFYGYGRVNMNRVLDAVDPRSEPSVVPPEVEITAPDWYELVDPGQSALSVDGRVWARGAGYRCRVLVAPGAYPNNAEAPAGDFTAVPSAGCDGTPRSLPLDGTLAELDLAALKERFPSNAGDFRGPEHGASVPEQPYSGRPNSAPYGFTIKIVADLVDGDVRAEDRRLAYLHRDRALLAGFPKRLSGDLEASPLLVDVNGDNRNDLVYANSDGVLDAVRRDGSSLPGFPVRGDTLPLHPDAPAFAGGEVDGAAGAILATPAAGDLNRDGRVELVAADLEGKIYVWNSRGQRLRTLRARRAYSGAPLTPFVNVRKGKLNRTQSGFLGSPVLADLDGNDGGRLEIIAAAMDRHVYAFNHDGTRVEGFPVLVVDRTKVEAIDPATHRVTFKPDVGADYDQGAIVDTPAVGDLTGDRRPEIVVGTNESYAEPINAAGVDQAVFAVLGEAALEPANGRLFAIRSEGEPGGPRTDSAPWLDGWPFRVGILQAEILPLVGEGVTGSPVIGQAPCRGDEAAPRVGVIPAAGIPYLVDPDGESCLGRTDGQDEALPTSGGAGADQPFLAAFGHPAFGALGGEVSFLAPVAGLQRAVDVVLPEYQGGQDYLAAWSTASGRLEPNWPRPVNDLQFLTGPSVGDIDGEPGEEAIGGTSSMDLQAFRADGSDVPGWPKLTGDWTVANPTLGSFGTLDTAAGARRIVISATRSGQILGHATEARACAPASWPRFHHDNANSGDSRRDAVLPGRPSRARLAGATLSFGSPGDDLLCGTPRRYQVRTSARAIGPATFARARRLAATGDAASAGERASLDLPGERLLRYVAVRAVDEQGNVGRPALVDRGRAATAPKAGQEPSPAKPLTVSPGRSGVQEVDGGSLPFTGLQLAGLLALGAGLLGGGAALRRRYG